MSSLKFEKVIKRDGSLVNFNQDEIINSIFRAAQKVGGRDRHLSEIVANEVVYFVNRSIGDKEIPSTEEINDYIEKILIERGHARTAKAFILDRARRRAFDTSQEKAQISGTIPFQKIWNIFVWNHQFNYETLPKLNKIVKDLEKWKDMLKKCDEYYRQDIKTAAGRIMSNLKKVKLVIIAGPSSSGKTTSTIKLEEYLKTEGKKFKTINVDNYFFDLELHPKDAYGDYDFETPMALDLTLFNFHLRELIKGKEVLTPFYDFPAGKRILDQIPLQIHEDEIILLDCLHGLYPDLTSSVAENHKMKIYIETLAQQRYKTGYFVRWTDIRLMRRMIRDMQFRGYTPEQTLTHWHYVRRAEMQYIIPHINSANIDYTLNGALAYELPIHKFYLYKYLPEWVEKYKDSKDRKDAYIRA
ncbi:MAG: ATP cone domain-containing protein, partial [Candidatus Heimdallarchaeota archaeon]